MSFRRAADGERMDPCTWKPVRRSHLDPRASAEPWTAAAVCANDHACVYSEHAVAPDGTVTPSVVCPYDNCGFHEMVKLEGWPP